MNSGQLVEGMDAVQGGEQHDHPVRQKPARRQAERLHGGPVDPVCVVDHADRRLLRARSCSDKKRCEALMILSVSLPTMNEITARTLSVIPC
ncbi:hypothetical protein [Mycobacterium tilburgii]|uniref:hypothetical protein n=1 Tax=Mycobacterium tilburgii TaxID=44467 RepID=UPI0021B39336|nr:hypothetical protein [Mycobacterium tilburgii]